MNRVNISGLTQTELVAQSICTAVSSNQRQESVFLSGNQKEASIRIENEKLINQAKEVFPIVGIGASAGGLDAIKRLLVNIPTDTGLAFIIVQHLDPNQESMLPEILSRSTEMPVQKIQNQMQIKPNNVYVIPSGSTMTINNGFLQLHAKGTSQKPIDEFLNSLALDRKLQAIGIILSGTGTDGTEGLRTIKVEGGITFAQEPKSAQYPDMPQSAIAAEVVYFVLTPEQIAEELTKIAKHPEITRLKIEVKTQKAQEETDMQSIYALLKVSSGVNFANYKKTTINRRITRRMVINKIDNIKKYVAYLRAHPEEQQALFDDLLINVTVFFREPHAFSALREKIFPELIKNRRPNQSIRVWIPGCSTGEEAYSIAIVLEEFLEEKNITDISIQIFGTDINAKNIDKARRGVYQKNIEDNVSEKRLKQFFITANGNYQVVKQIRDLCVFAKHDITQDPPFSNMDLIVCRNVLIYMESVLQEKILPLLNYALKPNGYLVLGESESVGKSANLFEAITKRGVIFKKKIGPPKIELPLQETVPFLQEKSLKLPQKRDFVGMLKEEVDQVLMAQYVPATLLVNGNSDILVFRGHVDPYISIEPGAPSFSITKMVRKELRPTVQTAIYRAKKSKKDIQETVRFEQDDQTKTVSIQVKSLKVPKQEEPFFLVLFEETKREPFEEKTKTPSTHRESERAKDQQIKELSEDLESTKQTLQTVIEQQEATNEELRSANEEVQSSNEELMSTNEELATSKEELQSTNEELNTLNDELKNRNQALSKLNDDLTNVIGNVDTAVVIVDVNFKIKRFTSSAQELLRLTPLDVDHQITEIRLGLPVDGLEKPLSMAVTQLKVVRSEIKAGRGRWYQMRIRPYLTEEKKIGGAVLSFVDITEMKKWESERKRYTTGLEQQVKAQAGEIARSETMVAIGNTAGMVGHDIRNPLQSMIGEIYLINSEVDKLPESEEKKSMRESLLLLNQNLEYINKIVADLQDYAKNPTPTLEHIDVEKTIREALSSLMIPKEITASLVMQENCPRLNLDAAYLKRIITNLVSNAIQAMMPDEGKVTVTVRCHGDGAFISVEDTGKGMSEEAKAKIFTPLFTTKAKGQGFGLAVVRKLTEAMGGAVAFESEVGKGTKFTLKFPLYD
jgi:two-component system CheB/CheR fusion protein